jgi:hypothetical protein
MRRIANAMVDGCLQRLLRRDARELALNEAAHARPKH